MNVKHRALSGEKVCGTMIRIVDSPAIIMLAKNSGLDFVMFDLEHSPFSVKDLHNACLLARSVELEVWARVPVATEDYISRILDMGASGIMAPLVETPEYAAELVKYSKFAPLGERGYNNGGPATLYKAEDPVEFMNEANDRVMSIVQIESGAAVERIDDILSVPGVDAAIIGPNDLSVSLGIPGQHMHPLEEAAIHTVAEACKKHKKLFTVHCKPNVMSYYKNDISFIMMGTEMDLIKSGFESIVKFTEEWDGCR